MKQVKFGEGIYLPKRMAESSLEPRSVDHWSVFFEPQQADFLPWHMHSVHNALLPPAPQTYTMKHAPHPSLKLDTEGIFFLLLLTAYIGRVSKIVCERKGSCDYVYYCFNS